MAVAFQFTDAPQEHHVVEIRPDVLWVRLPLPFSLDHINCYLLKDGEGWSVVDTGMNGEKSRQRWLAIFEQSLGGAKPTRVIATHHHPDHMGLAGWLCDHFQVPYYCSEAEYYYGRTFHSPKREQPYWETLQYLERTAMHQASVDALLHDFSYSKSVAFLPAAFHRLQDQDLLTIGEYQWRAIATRGHSPEHISLYCQELDLYISGDQVLPGITSNVSVVPSQASANPLKDWFAAHDKVAAEVPDSVLVLPAHELPFTGLHTRLQQVLDHHDERLDKILASCQQANTAQGITEEIFDRDDMEPFQNFLAVGEVVAHLNWLLSEGKLQRYLTNGFYSYELVKGADSAAG